MEIPQTLREQRRGIGADSPVLPLGQAAKCAKILIEISFLEIDFPYAIVSFLDFLSLSGYNGR